MMLKKISTLVLAGAALVAITTESQAVPFVFNNTPGTSFNLNITPLAPGVGPAPTTSNDITTASPLVISYTAPATAGGPSGGFAADTNFLNSGTPVDLLADPLTFNQANVAGFNAGIGTTDTIGVFTATTVDACVPGTKTISCTVEGTFTLGSDWTTSGAQFSAQELWTFNQLAGPGGSVAGGATTVLVVNSVPEPVTISLFGVGLAGIGFGLRRRKKAPTA